MLKIDRHNRHNFSLCLGAGSCNKMDTTDTSLANTNEITSPDPSLSSADAGESVSNNVLLRSILLTVQKSLEENNQLLRTFKQLPSHNQSESQDSMYLASEEAQSVATQVAPTPASQEAIDLTNLDSEGPKNAEEDALSIFGENDLNEENDKFLELIDETLCPTDGFGPPILVRRLQI